MEGVLVGGPEPQGQREVSEEWGSLPDTSTLPKFSCHNHPVIPYPQRL